MQMPPPKSWILIIYLEQRIVRNNYFILEATLKHARIFLIKYLNILNKKKSFVSCFLISILNYNGGLNPNKVTVLIRVFIRIHTHCFIMLDL